MNLNIDAVIVALFLIGNLTIGLLHSTNKKTLREYAVGSKSFSTGTITATIVATCIGGGFFSGAITETYKQGLYFLIPALGEPLCLIVVGYFLVPRMGEFLNNISIADALGNLFGKYVQIITAMAGIFLCIGIVALQFKVGSTIMQIFFDVEGFYSILICAIITTVYSAFGGIKAVTFTDIIQFFTFGAIIPIISLTIWGTLHDPNTVFSTLAHNPLFDYEQVFDFSNSKFVSSFFLLLFFLLPGFQPVFFQRIIIASNTEQGSKAFIIGGLICLVMLLIISWIGILLLSDKPNLDPNNLLPYIISTYNYTGLKGVTAVGIMAIIMSTADSYINSAAVLFTNDILKPLNINYKKLVNELTSACLFSFFVGIIGFFLAFKASTVLNLLLLIFSFYMPIVSVPLLFAVFGFRSTSVSVLTGMFGGFITVIIFKLSGIDIDSVIPGVIANTVFLFASHYVLRQPGGWVGIKNPEPLKLSQERRKRRIEKILDTINNFSFMEFCLNNAPKKEYLYSLFGLFGIISVFSIIYSIPHEVSQNNQQIIEFIYHTALISLSVFLTYPIWPPIFKSKKFIAVAWSIFVPYILLLSPMLLIIANNFSQFHLMILIVNIIIMATLARWQVVVSMMVFGFVSSIIFYKWVLGVNLPLDPANLQFKIIYSLLLLTSVLIAFFRPQQEQQILTETKNVHLSGRLSSQEEQMKEALDIRSEFIRNIHHEYRSPMTGITCTAEAFKEAYHKMTPEQHLEAIDIILKSSARLDLFDSNISALSKLATKRYHLKLEDVDLGKLIYDRLELCRKLYEEKPESHQFIMNIAENVQITADRSYLNQLLDNLIINAISYCKEGKITITLKQNDSLAEFIIEDEGIGIPANELHDIFAEFTVSSRTKTLAGGRGLGLALVRRVIEIHGGTIEAKSDGVKGAKIIFTLPSVKPAFG